jgi:hypothetical protein
MTGLRVEFLKAGIEGGLEARAVPDVTAAGDDPAPRLLDRRHGFAELILPCLPVRHPRVRVRRHEVDRDDVGAPAASRTACGRP